MITKVSEITKEKIQEYLRISEISKEDSSYLETIINIAKDFIKNNTGLTDDELDKYSDLVVVVYVLCQNLYDTRAYYVDGKNINNVVQTILDMHSRNLL